MPRSASLKPSLTNGYPDARRWNEPLSKSTGDQPGSNVEMLNKAFGAVRGGKRSVRRRHEYSVEGVNDVHVTKAPAEPLGCKLEYMKLAFVEQGTPAERHGLDSFVGRKLTHVNKHPVGCVDDVRSMASDVSAVHLRFADAPIGSKGKKILHVPDKNSPLKESFKRRLDGPPSHAQRVMAEVHEERRSVPIPRGIDTPFGTTINAPRPLAEFVAVSGFPGQPPSVRRTGRTGHPGKFKIPTNQTSEQLAMMGVTASGQRSRSVPVNGSFAPSPSQRRNRYVKKDTSAMLHHDTSVTRSETPRTVPHIRLVTPASPRPDSPSGRRRSTSHPAFKFNQTFLTHTDARPTENSMLRVARLRNEAVHGSHGYGDIIGNQYSGSMSHITPKIAKLRTGPIVISLPKVEYKYKGPTQQHPHPLPANSDIFNKQAYQTKTCQDMSDVVTASGKGCIRGRHGLPVNESDIFNQHSGHAKAPATPRGKALLGSRNMESRSFGRSRSYTPAMRVFPPWDTS